MNARTDEAQAIRVANRPARLMAGLEPLAEFSDRLDALDAALVKLGKLCGDSASGSIARLRRSLADFEPAVTMIGQVKSGKTTLVNALAGWGDLLPVDVNPWTSVITSLHLSPENRPAANGARFQFFDEDEWDRLVTKGGRLGELADRASFGNELETIREQIEAMREKSRARLGRKFELLLGQVHEYGYFDKNLVERYICLGDLFEQEDAPTDKSTGRFADITKSADLFLNSDALPARLCIRDTPGVNDTFMMREQITIRAIRESRLCVVVLSAHQALSSVDMALIRLISNLKSRDVVIFVNRIDELPDPAAQVAEIEASIRQTLADQNGPDNVDILFGSAFWANRALAGDVNGLPQSSAEALARCIEVEGAGDAPLDADLLWRMSGLPALYAALAERIISGVGEELVSKVSASAANIAGSLKMGEAIAVKGMGAARRPAPDELKADLHAVERRHLEALAEAMTGLSNDFETRVDRAQNSFIDRATMSLIQHLERHGTGPVWEYDPAGLRVLLRSGFTVFGSRSQSEIARIYEAAARDVAALYGNSFGAAVEGVEIKAPPVPRIAPPIMLGQTIALDLKGGWWTNWWRRKRGFDHFADNFRELIRAETGAITGPLKSDHPMSVHAEASAALREFFDEQREILTGLVEHADLDSVDAAEMLSAPSGQARRDELEDTMRTLTRIAV